MAEWTLSVNINVEDGLASHCIQELEHMGFRCELVNTYAENIVFDDGWGGVALLWGITKLVPRSHHKHKIAEFMMKHCDKNISLYKGFYHKWAL